MVNSRPQWMRANVTDQPEINVDELTFEAALRELEATVSQLESGDMTLEASLSLYERGQNLAARCSRQLTEANLKVEQLSAEGEIVELSVGS